MEPHEILRALAGYVPAYMLDQMRLRPEPPSAPTAEQFTAAVLYAEITGLDLLVARLAEQGPEGAEKLTQALNAYFWQLFDEITSQGGDVARCAGDTVLALWPARDGEQKLVSQVRRAAQCALSLSRALHHYTAAEETLNLRLGVAAGEVCSLNVGGSLGRWEYVTTGASVAQARAVAAHAQPGEVYLTAAAHALAAREFVGEPQPGGFCLRDTRFPLPPAHAEERDLPPAIDRALRSYVPGAVLNQLTTRGVDFLAEIRPLTVMALNLPEITYQTPLEDVQAAMRALQGSVYRFAGSINALRLGAEGMTLTAAFGLPPVAHDDDPTRGLQAAHLAHTELQQRGLALVGGVTSAPTFCGVVGNPHRRVYALVGPAVNAAAHLMYRAAARETAAHNGAAILCDLATHAAAQEALDSGALPRVALCAESLPSGPPSLPEAILAERPDAPEGATSAAVETASAPPDAPWEPTPLPAETFHADAPANINRSPLDPLAGVYYKRGMDIKRVRYDPLHPAPEMPVPWQGRGPTVVEWLFSELPDTREGLLESARFGALQAVTLPPGSATGQCPADLDTLLYVISGNGVLHHRPTDGSPVIARPLRPGDAALIRSGEYHSFANEAGPDDLRLLIVSLRR